LPADNTSRESHMEDAVVELVEELFSRKIMLYHDLLHCFRQEKESLLRIDLDRLWKIAGEKEELCSKIQSLRQEIMDLLYPETDNKSLNLNRLIHLIPVDKRAVFQKLYLALIRLKREIEVLRKENMVFINDSLQFLDEIMSIISGETRAGSVYNDKCHLVKSESQILLSKEA
jgi:hypothetical protein